MSFTILVTPDASLWQAQIIHLPPNVPPPLPSKPKLADHMDIDITPSGCYNLRKHPQPSKICGNVETRKHTRNDDDWDDPDFVSKMKRRRSAISKEALEIVREFESEVTTVTRSSLRGRGQG